MNKKLLTIAALAATAGTAHAQSSVTLYGVIDAGISYVNHNKTANGGTDKLFKYDDGVAGAAVGACAAPKTSVAA